MMPAQSVERLRTVVPSSMDLPVTQLLMLEIKGFYVKFIHKTLAVRKIIKIFSNQK
jgi:hypothetical protein